MTASGDVPLPASWAKGQLSVLHFGAIGREASSKQNQNAVMSLRESIISPVAIHLSIQDPQ
jgi:curli biogenesis system outer membrane secretion channel CsgG